MSFSSFPSDQASMLLGAWLVYFSVHSILASLQAKRVVARYLPNLMPAYRLMYNLIAVILLLPPVYLVYGIEWPWLWRWNGLYGWLANGLALIAVGLFYWTLKYYDSGEFIGIRQWRQGIRGVEDQERFQLSPLHRFVRHPWYFLGLVLIWTRDMNGGVLLSAIPITLYFILGSRLEERKLLRYHGEVYRRYRGMVPGLLPSPWRFLSRQQAEELTADARVR